MTTNLEIFVLVDDRGDTAIGRTDDEAKEKYEEDVQALADCGGFRLVKVTVKVPLPECAALELEAEAPALGEPAGRVA